VIHFFDGLEVSALGVEKIGSEVDHIGQPPQIPLRICLTHSRLEKFPPTLGSVLRPVL
jgi:hypothetical protein